MREKVASGHTGGNDEKGAPMSENPIYDTEVEQHPTVGTPGLVTAPDPTVGSTATGDSPAVTTADTTDNATAKNALANPEAGNPNPIDPSNPDDDNVHVPNENNTRTTPTELRCNECGVDGKDQGDYYQCPICMKRLHTDVNGPGEQPAIPVREPQPVQAQKLQRFTAEEQGMMEHGDYRDEDGTNTLTETNYEPTPEYKPENDEPSNDNTMGPVPAFSDLVETIPDEPTGGRQGDPSLGADGLVGDPLRA